MRGQAGLLIAPGSASQPNRSSADRLVTPSGRAVMGGFLWRVGTSITLTQQRAWMCTLCRTIIAGDLAAFCGDCIIG